MAEMSLPLLLIIFLAIGLIAVATCMLALRFILRRRGVDFSALENSIEDGLLLIDEQAKILAHNTQAAALMKAEGSDFTGQALSLWLKDSSGEQLQVFSDRQLGTSLNLGHEILSFTRLAREPRGLLLLVRHHNLEQDIRQDIARYHHSQYFAKIGTWDWQVGTDTLYWSDAIFGIFGYKLGEVTPSYEFFYSRVHPEDRDKVKAGEARCIATGENHDEEYRILWPDGSVHWVRETGNLVKDSDGQLLKMVGVVRDITQEKALHHKLEKMAHQDPLTGLPNRLQLELRLSEAIREASQSGGRLGLIFIDLNQFKAINDSLGHQVGDRVLMTAATRLQSLKGSEDLVARIGGDEFVMLLPQWPADRPLEEEVARLAEALFERFAEPVIQTGRGIAASIGFAIYPDHAGHMDALLHVADQAMYIAKGRGDNQYHLGPDHRMDLGHRLAR
ncbi:sensor domain-containing diguanylate cyclase [Shewanella loihica]|uniref:Diguanylate cyclase with PAS/PAC sensor n=1 Tax=Shewanella loihica (strain ATCC BAA-1088 / PV-4) TaxID=323850 RepID=A3QAV6_SHELP|nr:diguanylate cyclase with PAS/PAC sensor [Shewanella loihica PV-4]